VTTPYYSDESVTLHLGDAREIVASVAATVTLTDPPYNVGKDYGPGYDDRRIDYLPWLRDIFGALPGDVLVYTPGAVNVLDTREVLGGWDFQRLLGWHRREFAGDKWCGGPAMSWEPVVWASRGEPRYNKRFGHAGRDFLIVNSTHGDPFARLHPCPKPVAVMSWLVGLFATAEDIVLDPFAGTGSTLVAARSHGVKSVGIEQNEAYCELIAQRFEQGVLDFGDAS
jgi:DNA modification methylase